MGEKLQIDLTPSQKEEVKKILACYVSGVEVWAYGSRVQGTSSEASDLDMVVFASRDELAQISLLIEAFENSYLPFRVDLFIWNNLPKSFHDNVINCYFIVQKKGGALRLPRS